eukprot:CAMPEP_0113638746 /NCGR_PEP_ID=MMETSP0017_2-20120614/20310_1 /TAXON_ID=2856 /ORGANISM="Cylindrotheca closterium" /LENGTH=488 /DNA_ID=CAMNT_0000549893 /DNA_START=50 /DNA_END=1516 /DNA_ORIENTATION=- /assembly_acc=CAM_ASM_000147
MKLNHFNPASFCLLLWLVVASVQARQGQHGGGRPGGLFGGGRPGFPGLDQEFVNKTCDASFECPLRRKGGGHNHNNNDIDNQRNGTFVCRTTYHPVSGAERKEARCIPTDRAFDSDDCGCCGEDCPTRPDFEEITCEGQEDLLATISRPRHGGRFDDDGGERRRRGLMGGMGGGFGGGGGGYGPGSGGGRDGGMGGGMDGDTGAAHFGGGMGGGGGRSPAIVCREVYNPFTGDQERVTIPIQSTKSLDGDVCGCCDGICPDEISRKPFERPQEVEIACTGDELITCTIPKRKGHGPHHNQQDDADAEEEEEEEGVFVCRSRADPLTGAADTKPICIPTDAAWDSDQCGCCGETCPEKPVKTDIDCPLQEHQCERRNGQAGVFVCRSLFHPLNEGDVVDTSLCIPEDKGWETDDCGCCESGCPTTPQGGFEDEDTQIMSFAMTAAGEFSTEEYDSTVENAAAAPTSGVSRLSFSTTLMSIVMIAGAMIW